MGLGYGFILLNPYIGHNILYGAFYIPAYGYPPYKQNKAQGGQSPPIYIYFIYFGLRPKYINYIYPRVYFKIYKYRAIRAYIYFKIYK